MYMIKNKPEETIDELVMRLRRQKEDNELLTYKEQERIRQNRKKDLTKELIKLRSKKKDMAWVKSHCVNTGNVKDAEEISHRIKDLHETILDKKSEVKEIDTYYYGTEKTSVIRNL